VGEAPRRLDVLVVAVRAESFLALGPIACAQCLAVDSLEVMRIGAGLHALIVARFAPAMRLEPLSRSPRARRRCALCHRVPAQRIEHRGGGGGGPDTSPSTHTPAQWWLL